MPNFEESTSSWTKLLRTAEYVPTRACWPLGAIREENMAEYTPGRPWRRGECIIDLINYASLDGYSPAWPNRSKAMMVKKREKSSKRGMGTAQIANAIKTPTRRPVNPLSTVARITIIYYSPAYPYPIPLSHPKYPPRTFSSMRNGQLLHYVEELYYTRAFTIYQR